MLHVGFETIVNGQAVRLTQYVKTIEGKEYWWCETIFVPQTDALMVGFRQGNSYRALHGKTMVAL